MKIKNKMEEEKLSDKYKASEGGGGDNPAPDSAPIKNSVSYINRIISEARECMMTILMGSMGSGKSHGIIQLARGYATDNPITGKRARPAFIFDANGEEEYAKAFPNAITPKQILSITRPDVYRILPIKDNGDLMDDEEIREAMIFIAKNSHKAVLFFDDVDSYFSGTKPRELSRLFMGLRHKGGRDVVFIHQRWSVVLPQERAAARYIVMRHTSESVELTKERWKNPELLLIAENIVEEQYELAEKKYLYGEIDKNEYKKRRSFFLDIDTQLNKIIGAYSRRCFERNCEKYINANPAMIARFQKINCDKNGDSIYDREQAIAKIIETRLWKYFAGKE